MTAAPPQDWIRLGLVTLPAAQGKLASTWNNGAVTGRPVERVGRGWFCVGCRGVAAEAVGLVPFLAEHARCGWLVGHRDYCLKRQGQTCSCGEESGQ